MTPPRIVVAVDFTASANRVCHAAAEQARCMGAEVVLVHVVHQLAELLGAYTEQSVTDLQASLEREGGDRLRKLAQEHFAPKGVEHRVVLLVGTPWAEVLDCALREDAALLVVGTHSRSKPEHAFAGSTAQRVIDHARCNVLLVPPE